MKKKQKQLEEEKKIKTTNETITSNTKFTTKIKTN